VTTRREVPLTGDTLAWVHTELSEIKSRLAIVQQAAEQSRSLATDAAETSHQVRTAISQFDGVGAAIQHAQNDLRSVREALVRAQDDVHSLRQFREEAERQDVTESERVRQDHNEVGRRFSDIERYIESWSERLAGAEEHNRRTLEVASQLTMRLETLETMLTETDSSQSRAISTLSRMDGELQRISGAVLALQSEDNSQRERINSSFEALRRLEGDLETVRGEANKISRIDDRLELVQAERTRHNERLNEITEELAQVDDRMNQADERASLIEARMAGYQDDLRKLREYLQTELENIAGYLGGLRELEADIRKREIVALEKEIRDIRGRAYDVTQE
jgi:peptidoglycan hydrolase CwlO-like protein